MTEQRRLAAILVADVVGYSTLVGRDEAGTLARLSALRSDIVDPAIARHAGRLFKSMGDGFLVEFASAVQAVACAKAIQDVNSGELKLRIGIHLGDVVVQGDDLLGDGVNIAARVEGVAEPGGIAISRAVHEQVRDKLDLKFVDKGQVELKNLVRPVRVFALGGAKEAEAPVLALPDKPSIAVLPFQNMSGDPEQEYFADGISEDIITELTRFRSLFVIARNSSFSYKGKSPDIRDVGRELGVRYVLEGSSRKAGDRVRLTGQLIDAQTGRHIWAERYDRQLDDVFAVQEELTRSIVRAIAPHISEAELARANRRRPDNLTAYELAVRASAMTWDAFARSDAKLADEVLRLADSALTIDPGSYVALEARAFGQYQHLARNTAADRSAAWRQGMADSERMIELDRSAGSGFVWKALFLIFGADRGRLEEALASARYGHELNPHHLGLLNGRAYVETMAGDPEISIQLIKEALRLSPRDPLRPHLYQQLTMASFHAGRYDDAIGYARLGLAEASGLPPLHVYRACSHVALGQLSDAKEAFAAARRAGSEYVDRLLAGSSPLASPTGQTAISTTARAARLRDLLRVAAELDRPSEAKPATTPALSLPDKPSIAVLPFENMSGDPEQEYFADGIVEDIITALSRDRGLLVIARNSSFTYKGRAVDVRQVGRELAVRYVLEGSIRKAGNNVRITGQLIDASSGHHIWADRFDGGLEDVFALQDGIANKVASVISPTVESAEIERAVRKTSNLDAYDLYLRAKAAYGAMTPQAMDEALRLAEASLALDSSYARCHALIAAIYIQRLVVSMSVDPVSDSLAAEQAAQRALSLDANDAWVLAIQASVLMFGNRQHRDALPLLEKALSLDANLALAWTYRGMCNNTFGRWEDATRDFDYASRLNPRDPWRWVADHARAWGHLMQGQNDEAAARATAALQMRPGFLPSLKVAIAAHAFAGRLDKARELVTAHAALEPNARISTIRDLYIRRTSPEAFDKLADGLRKAGFPE